MPSKRVPAFTAALVLAVGVGLHDQRPARHRSVKGIVDDFFRRAFERAAEHNRGNGASRKQPIHQPGLVGAQCRIRHDR